MEAGTDRDQVERALQDLLPQALILTQQTHASTQRTRADVDIFQNLTLVFPILAYLVASMVVLTTLTRMIPAPLLGEIPWLAENPENAATGKYINLALL